MSKTHKIKKKNYKKKIGTVESHFLDSGAFTLWTKAAEYHKEHGGDRWCYYETPEFWEYMDSYAAFIKKYKIAIDLYANVDAIGNPQLTWRNQKYLEKKHGLNPVPVVHYPTNTKWLKRYMKVGYEIIGLGGLVGSTMKASCRDWLNKCFDIVCDSPNRLPKVKIHGFGVTSYKLLLCYPWWSIDFTTWVKSAAFGEIYIPHKRKGLFTFDVKPYHIAISTRAGKVKVYGRHYLSLSLGTKKIINEWLNFINVPLGVFDENENPKGVLNSRKERINANVQFFEMMRASIPKYPKPFYYKHRRKLLC